MSRMTSRRFGAFSQRDMVGCEHRSSPLSGSAAGQLEGGVKAQPIEIVGILVAAGDCQNASPQNLRQPVHKPQRITWISDHRRKLLGDREPPFGLRENHHPTVRGDPSAIERSCDLLAGNGWKGERKEPIVGHGGYGSARSSESDGFSTHPIRYATPANIQIPSL